MTWHGCWRELGCPSDRPPCFLGLLQLPLTPSPGETPLTQKTCFWLRLQEAVSAQPSLPGAQTQA